MWRSSGGAAAGKRGSAALGGHLRARIGGAAGACHPELALLPVRLPRLLLARKLARAGMDPYSEQAMFDACRAAQAGRQRAPIPLSTPPHVGRVRATLLAAVPCRLLRLAAAAGRRPRAAGPRHTAQWPRVLGITALAFGFNGSVAASLRAGQVGLITAALVVLGIELWQRGRLGGFVGAVTPPPHCQKIWPGALLALGAGAATPYCHTRLRGRRGDVAARAFSLPLALAWP